MNTKIRYWYNANVVSVYDGDTITVDIDLGFNLSYKNVKIRLFGLNTPEIRGESKDKGLEARDWLRDRVLGKDIRLNTIKDKTGKYGRYLGIIFIDNMNLNYELIDRGLAEEKIY